MKFSANFAESREWTGPQPHGPPPPTRHPTARARSAPSGCVTTHARGRRTSVDEDVRAGTVRSGSRPRVDRIFGWRWLETPPHPWPTLCMGLDCTRSMSHPIARIPWKAKHQTASDRDEAKPSRRARSLRWSCSLTPACSLSAPCGRDVPSRIDRFFSLHHAVGSSNCMCGFRCHAIRLDCCAWDDANVGVDWGALESAGWH